MIERKPLRNDVQDEVLSRIAGGAMPPGHRINESQLSGELGISRTPLREALIGLQQRGFLVSSLGRGFLVPPLSRRGIREILEVLSLLEPEALRLSGPPAPALLVDLGNEISRAHLDAGRSGGTGGTGKMGGAAEIQRLHRFHTRLLRACPHTQLRVLATHLDQHTLRYIVAALGQGWDVTAVWDELAALTEELRTRDVAAAAERLARLRRQQAVTITACLPGEA